MIQPWRRETQFWDISEKSISNTDKEVFVPLYMTLVRHHVEYACKSGRPSSRKVKKKGNKGDYKNGQEDGEPII